MALSTQDILQRDAETKWWQIFKKPSPLHVLQAEGAQRKYAERLTELLDRRNKIAENFSADVLSYKDFIEQHQPKANDVESALTLDASHKKGLIEYEKYLNQTLHTLSNPDTIITEADMQKLRNATREQPVGQHTKIQLQQPSASGFVKGL
jgi:hypothetical protein